MKRSVRMFGCALMILAGFVYSAEAADVSLSLPDVSVEPGGVGTAAIKMENLESEVLGVQIVLKYDPNVVKTIKIQKAGRTDHMDVLESNVVEPGILKLLVFDLEGESISKGEGDIVNVEFTVSPDASLGGVSPLEIIFTEDNTNTTLADLDRLAIKSLQIKDGAITIGQSEEADGEGIPGSSSLLQNFPNPWNPSTVIKYHIAQDGHVNLSIYNIAGQLVRNLVDDTKKAGKYDVQWDGKDNSGRVVTSGVYFYKIAAENFKSTRKMILLR